MDTGIDILLQLKKKRPLQPEIRNLLAIAYAKQNKIDKAISEINELRFLHHEKLIFINQVL